MARWVAVSLNPDLYEQYLHDSEKTFPEATTWHYTWTPVEDHLLDVWTRMILQETVQHLSLHFDGVMVDPDRVRDDQQFIVESEDAIFMDTGYKVKIALKQNFFF